MKKVTIIIESEDGKKDAAVIITETNRGIGGWNRVDSRDVVTNGDEEEFVLRPGQRLVIDAFPKPDLVYDREQGAAVDPSQQKNSEGLADKPKEGQSEPPAPKQTVKPNVPASPGQSTPPSSPASTSSSSNPPDPKANAAHPMKSSADMK